MSLIASIGELLQTLREERVRTASTLLGLAWGTFAILVLLSFGTGLERHLQQKAANLGPAVAIAFPQRTTLPYDGWGPGRPVLIRRSQVLALRTELPGLRWISPEYIGRDQLSRGTQVVRVTVSGVHPDYARLRTWRVEPDGRFLNDRDLAEARRVVVLGNRVKQVMFGDRGAVGEALMLRGARFRVIGVLAPKLQDSSYSSEDQDRVCLPATTFEDVFGERFVSAVVYRADRLEEQPRVTAQIRQALARGCGFSPADEAALQVWDTAVESRMRFYIFLGFDLMLGGSAVLTLLVGGVGVGNLMFIRVRKRTREIGIQMALGARPRAILAGVLCETLILVVAGGLLGAGAAAALILVTGATPLTAQIGTPEVSLLTAVGTILLLSGVGVLGGWFPARRAARLDPVQALTE